MLRVQCRKCGQIQDAGNALAPNDVCERCATRIYGSKARNPVTIARLAVTTLIAAAIAGMPQQFFILIAILAIFLTGNATAGQRRGSRRIVRFQGWNWTFHSAMSG
jgi:hypothetical protein